MASTADERGRTDATGVVHGEASSLAAAAVAEGGTHVAVVARETVDDWYRRLGAAGTLPARTHFVGVDDTVRGAATAGGPGGSTRGVGSGVSVSVAERPLGPEFPEFVDAALADAGTAGGSLVVDDPAVLVEAADGDSDADDDPDADAAVDGAVLDAVAASAADAGVALHLGAPADGDDATAAALWRRFRPADDATGRALAAAALDHLRAVDPTNFGYLRRYWREARRGLEAVEMTYPQAKQVHATLSEPETTTRTLGAALQALVRLGALGVWGETVAANRYDMTGYDPERVAAIGDALSELDD
ncbi:hypothetical protein [Candidatus Halobonum tyrrellensis]|uniref:Uncharacterized protein n=1 Tax=Candidatus Halobonum tyrrellensis G22 TaxID=1324957 RepID=V4IVM5_9EURY|nr:hypothetical protein [Candidatus Halobonum tyrrellensis]ESP87252.1 hypothetical protein K933_15344 [Candidatus Halobonum tyrrellensis G22]